ncbi:hypothetical protein SBRCBS47491_007971 [Sporothrix bragantina]|uniref:U1-type domain-containing protein n=1 Tax=Sporothrix bragantina TaxID=671064 RepID=A0ABP0CIW8_9PEZI
MADYWKSTPKYWCKHCQVYVPDTKLQRANHEATGKHQSAVRRALRNLHRDHERQEREKDFAKREVARLNAIVDAKHAAEGGGSSSNSSSNIAALPRPSRPPPPTKPTQPPPASSSNSNPPREQLEQLAELGVSIPDAFRPDLAMAGDWTVTETRVVEVQEEGDNTKKGPATKSFGVRKRPRGNPDDDEDDEDKHQDGGHSEFEKVDLDTAVQGLFKRPRQWGRDSRTAGGSSSGLGDDIGGDLDSLLSSAVAKPAAAKKEEGDETKDNFKKEDGTATTDDNAAASIPAPPQFKKETDTDTLASGLAGAAEEGKPAAEPAVMFKKRKAKPGRK